jgi:hypothetical protein
MDNDKEFDDLIKSKLSEQEFPFDEENWDAAEEMIYDYRKRERIKRVAIIFASGLLLGVLMMLPFVLVKQDEVQSYPLVIANNTINSKNSIDENSVSKPESENNKKKQQDLNKEVTQIKVLTETLKAEAPVTTHQEHKEIYTPFAANVKRTKKTIVNKQSTAKEKQTVLLNEQNNVTSTIEEVTSQVALNTTDSIATPEIVDIQVLAKDTLAILDSILVIKDSLLAKTDSVITSDSSVVADTDNKSDTAKKEIPHHSAFVEAYMGASYVRKFGLNTMQGITVYLPAGKNVAVGTGLGYTFLTLPQGAVKSIVTDITYGLGYTSDVTEIKTNKIHYFVVPAYLQYNIDEKSAMLIGAVNYFLSTVTNTYSTYKESYGEKNNVQSEKTYGYSSGINKYDIALVLGCKRNLFYNIGLAAYFNYGLTDIKRNGYYSDDTFERNISGQLLITYKLR